jgi:hypothetical protein
MYKILVFAILTGIALISCQKQSGPNQNARLFLSADSVSFDTVFTSVGAVTQQVKLINNNDQAISINTISLQGGGSSSFIINIDGTPGPNAKDLNIPANDSLIIFVTVFIQAGTAPTPFILQDSILLNYNGINQYIQLSAWGQNAHFIKNQEIKVNTTWPDDLPYVIYGELLIDSNASLTIQAGTHIYIHSNAPILVNGSLQVLGDSGENKQVYFSGDRLDEPYNLLPGSWPGIYFNKSSKGNVLNYTSFQNGNHTLVVQEPSTDLNPKLSLNQCVINNSLAEGILGMHTSITAINCLVSNCGQNIVIGQGGTYRFEHCTVATYSTNLLSHQQPVLTVSNAATDGNQVFISDLDAGFLNCIFWGSQGVTDEALVIKQGNSGFTVLFDHSILKQQNYPANIDSSYLWLNTDPDFIAAGSPGNSFNFQLKAGSPAVDHGANLGITVDLLGNQRPVNLPDLGCYERQ